MLRTVFYACCFFAALCGEASAQEQAVLERDAALLAEPRNGAAAVAQLKQGTSGEVIARKASWVNLRTASGTGWLFSFNVRVLAPGSGPAAASRAPTTVARPQARITPTIGIRGLDEEDMRGARFDADQMRLLDQYAASRRDAESAARASGLASTRVE